MFMLLSISVTAVAYSDSPQMKVTLMSQTPDPVEPGEIVTIKFKVENTGKETTNEAILQILPTFPLTLYGDKAEKNIGVLRASSTGADAVIVEFRLKVDENAAEGDTELELNVRLGDAGITYDNNEFLVDIQTADAILDITEVEVEPREIPPGERATVRITVKNKADSLLRDIKIRLDLFSSTLPLAPIQSSSERRLAQLQTEYQDTVQFQLIAEPDATPGLYKIPLNITYTDEQGKKYTMTDLIAVAVGEIPKIKAYLKKSTVFQEDNAGTLTLEIANAGTTDVQFLEVTLIPSPDYELVSTSNYFYIGDVDSDDTESEEIQLFVKDDIEILHFPVLLTYSDAHNQQFHQQFNLELPLHSTRELKRYGVIESSNGWLIVVILLLGTGGYGYYWWRKKNKKNFAK
ncbi:TPA: hypothetical protein HA241_07665 [Candidatus Woesearchaeota archaeon]|nr:hypothetical protein [Candidatus Woesearchaeota archaeon]